MEGKILKIKTGYNPNSSSVGTQIPTFLLLGLGSGILSIIIVQLFNFIDKCIQKKKDDISSG
ncbi:MAG: hypothetical protein HQK79_13095 [Desulfobacterales bacterium]|nr:hypothetical protein [Desulfobacterales bacterium]